jgi:putative ABC transport system ATP-binding protein
VAALRVVLAAARGEETTMAAVIEMAHIVKTYGKGPSAVKALSDVSIQIDKGEFVAILGPSGSGKSTLMNIIGLIDNFDSGTYLLDGVDIKKQSEKRDAKIRNEKIGFVFQKFNLIAKYSSLYNVSLPLLLRGEKNKEAKRKAKEMLEKVGLGDRVKHRPNQLSGGQQQRVAIARALIGDCSLILADEPTGNLDKKTGVDVIQILNKLNDEGKTIVLITHDLNVAKNAKRVIRFEDGSIVD